MAETPPTDVLVAGYQNIAEATEDFEALVALVKAKQVTIDGVILVTHAHDGSVSVRQTGDHLGRKGAGWGGGVGVAVGLFAPPLLASVAVGAVAAEWSAGSSTTESRRRSTTRSARTCPPGRPGSSRSSMTTRASGSGRRSRGRNSARLSKATSKGSGR